MSYFRGNTHTHRDTAPPIKPLSHDVGPAGCRGQIQDGRLRAARVLDPQLPLENNGLVGFGYRMA